VQIDEGQKNIFSAVLDILATKPHVLISISLLFTFSCFCTVKLTNYVWIFTLSRVIVSWQAHGIAIKVRLQIMLPTPWRIQQKYKFEQLLRRSKWTFDPSPFHHLFCIERSGKSNPTLLRHTTYILILSRTSLKQWSLASIPLCLRPTVT
jgi:hypothetical protein